MLHNSRKHHSHCLLSERCPLELGRTQSAQLYMEALHLPLRSCKWECTVANAGLHILRFTPGLTLTCGCTHLSHTAPHKSAVHTHTPSTESPLHAGPHGSSGDAPHPALQMGSWQIDSHTDPQPHLHIHRSCKYTTPPNRWSPIDSTHTQGKAGIYRSYILKLPSTGWPRPHN